MLKIVKILTVFLLITLLASLFAVPALSYMSDSSSRNYVPTFRLPDGVVGEPYSGGQIRPRNLPADTTWDIWEGNPPPPIWSVALYERGLDAYFSPDYTHSDPWDLPYIQESWYGTLPPGLFLDHIGGLIWGTPTERGRYVLYAPSFLADGTQVHVPYHSINIKERLETPDIAIRAVRDTVLQWDAIPEANGYLLYVNGVLARTIGNVTYFDLDDLNLIVGAEEHYINLVAISTDELLINSYVSNAARYNPTVPGNEVFGTPGHPRVVFSAGNTVPQTSVHDVTGSFIAMCISIFVTVSMSVYVFFHIRRKSYGASK